MRRSILKMFKLWLSLFLIEILQSVATLVCNRSPDGFSSFKSPVHDKFRIELSGTPDKYVPGENYRVTLQGARGLYTTQKFVGFMLIVESIQHFPNFPSEPHSGSAGTFHLLGDALTKFSERCPNMVTHTSAVPKSEIQVLWKAPPTQSGCVVFKATVIEQKDLWYQDDGPLSKVVCEDIQESHDQQPNIVNKCCTCDEAKYEMIFEGLWSRHTHPKDFPTNSWLTRFSDVIGASHTSEYKFWEYGGVASEGLRQVAESGATRMLESELKSQSKHIRTIIKARGISYPNVTGKTFAVFRVDRKHHLISIASMIDPSPDWIVGVSGLELCLPNCSWVQSKTFNMYPWDIGTDSGITYIAPDLPTVPQERIRKITSSWPEDPKSPFYDASGAEMKPLARLILNQQRLYEKTCSDSSKEDAESNAEECEVGEWQEWSPCSESCGQGIKLRQRQLKEGIPPENCLVSLVSRAPCYSYDEILCRQRGQGDSRVDPACEVNTWSEWSKCSSECGKGVQARFRTFVNPEASKECFASQNHEELEQTTECVGQGESCPNKEEESITEPSPDLEDKCAGSWSVWSPCSVTCGSGTRQRVREQRTTVEVDEDQNCSAVSYTETIECVADLSSCEITEDQTRDPNEDTANTMKPFPTGLSPESQIVATTRPTEIMGSTSESAIDCVMSEWSKWSKCSLPCGGYKERTRTVLIYPTNGGKPCQKRVIRTRKCSKKCGSSSKEINKGAEVPGSKEDETNSDDTECKYQEWSQWTVCSATCGDHAEQQRVRGILPPSAPICTDRLQTRPCHVLPCKM